MTKTNYAKDAELLDLEIDDFDTSDYDTTGSHPTGINVSRMRLPNRYDIAKFYQRLKRDSKVIGANGEIIVRRKGEYGHWKNKKAENLPDISDDFDWQITYSFPSTIRDNTTETGHFYGGKHVTFRRLYLILCERADLGNGDYFIDDYFDTVYPYTVKPEVDAELREVKEFLISQAEDVLEGAVVTKRGRLDARYKVNKEIKKNLKSYQKFARAWEDKAGERVAKMIKDDIIYCMESGQLQAKCIQHINDIETTRQRIQKGLPPYPVYVATKRLINSIQLYVKIGGKGTWQTKQGILV